MATCEIKWSSLPHRPLLRGLVAIDLVMTLTPILPPLSIHISCYRISRAIIRDTTRAQLAPSLSIRSIEPRRFMSTRLIFFLFNVSYFISKLSVSEFNSNTLIFISISRCADSSRSKASSICEQLRPSGVVLRGKIESTVDFLLVLRS